MSGIKANQDIIDRLKYLSKVNDGRLTPEMVVDDALDEDSPLHGAGFNWDKDAAAYQHWLDHARQLIRSVRVTIETTERSISVPYYYRDPEADAKQQGYISYQRIASEEDLKRAMLVEEYKRIERKLSKLRDIAEALGALPVHDELIVTVGISRQHVEATA